jgi:hypothetical protein
MQLDFHNFVSFPNYQKIMRSNKIAFRGPYISLEDIIQNLYYLNFQDKHIREVYSAFHGSVLLINVLQTIRAVIIQTEPVCSGVDKILVLDNKSSVPLSERVLYIRMYDFADGKLRKCNDFQNALLNVLFGLFAIAGLLMSVRSMFEMIIS